MKTMLFKQYKMNEIIQEGIVIMVDTESEDEAKLQRIFNSLSGELSPQQLQLKMCESPGIDPPSHLRILCSI